MVQEKATLLTLPYDVLHLIFEYLRLPRRLATYDPNFIDPNDPDLEPPSIYVPSLRVHRNLHPIVYPLFLSRVHIRGQAQGEHFVNCLKSPLRYGTNSTRGEMVNHLIISLDVRLGRKAAPLISPVTFERILLLTRRLRSFAISNTSDIVKNIHQYDSIVQSMKKDHWDILENFTYHGTRKFIKAVYPSVMPLLQNWAFKNVGIGEEKGKEEIEEISIENGKSGQYTSRLNEFVPLKDLSISVRDWTSDFTMGNLLVPIFRLTSCALSNVFISDGQLDTLLSSSRHTLKSLTLEELRVRPFSETFAQQHQSLSNLPVVLSKLEALKKLRLKTTLSDHSRIELSTPFRKIYPLLPRDTKIERLDILVDDIREEVILNLPSTLKELFCCFPFGLGEYWLPLGRMLEEGRLGSTGYHVDKKNGREINCRLKLEVLRHHSRQIPNMNVREQCALRGIKVVPADWFDI